MTKNGTQNRIGPYSIIDILGRGGMGVVYRAEHAETGSVVALKTVQVRNLSQVSSIRREIRALARINHPGVVRIIDEGIQGEIPWYAMEFLEGITLRKYCTGYIWRETADASRALDEPELDQRDDAIISSHWWRQVFGTTKDGEEIQNLDVQVNDVPQVQKCNGERTTAAGGALPAVLNLVHRLCRTLSYLHGEGMIHGDLKPDNIMVCRDGMPIIMDFGLVTHLWGDVSREQLAVDGISGGTVMYIAPEKILGDLVDARADLYSLGCMLYKLVTGRLPFSGHTPGQVIKAQLEYIPVSPSELVDDVPEELDRLILQLLTKNPKDRLSHSDDVSRVLIDLGAQADDWKDSPKPRPYLYRPRFAGRDKEIRKIEEQLDQLQSGKGSLVLIGGESGIGKTRFLLRLIYGARQRKITVLSGECTQMETNHTGAGKEISIPLQALKQPLKKIAEDCLSKGRVETDRILGSRGKVFSVHEPFLSELPGQEAYPEPVVLPANAARLRLYTSLIETFKILTADHPYLLVLDDLQWGDDLTLGFLEFILRTGQLNHIRLLIIGTYRTEELNPVLQRIINSPASCHMELGRLNEEAVSTIVTDMLGMSESPSVFVPFLTRFSEGNPFFVSEYLRTALEAGVLYRDGQGFWQVSEESGQMATFDDFESLPLPGALAGLLERRLSNLSKRAGEVVTAASVLGRNIPVLLLWSVIQFSNETLDAIDELIKKQVLLQVKTGELCFVHDKFRQIVYGGIPQAQCSKLHFSAAEAIESIYGEEVEEHFTALARHWELAGDKVKAQNYYLSIARQAVSRYALFEAEIAYRAYLNLRDQPTPENIKVRNEFVRKVLFILGRFKEALAESSGSLEDVCDLDSMSIKGECLLDLARINGSMGNLKKAVSLCRESLEIFHKEGDLPNEADAMNCLGNIYRKLGKIDEAKSLYKQSMQIYGKLKDQQSVGIVSGHLAIIYCNQGNFLEGQVLFEQALSIYRKLGKKESEGSFLGNIANIYLHYGEDEKALAFYREAHAIQRKIGNKQGEANILNNLATYYLDRDKHDKAQQFLEQTLKLQQEILDRRMESVTLGNLAIVYYGKGLPQEALELVQQALAIQEEVGDKQSEAINLVNLAEMIRLIAGDFKSAKKHLKKAILTFQKTGEQSRVALCLCQLGHLELAKGHSCRKYLDQVTQIIDETKQSGEFEKECQKLKRAEEAFKSGTQLFHGECIEDIPDNLRNWLIEAGELNIHKSTGCM